MMNFMPQHCEAGDPYLWLWPADLEMVWCVTSVTTFYDNNEDNGDHINNCSHQISSILSTANIIQRYNMDVSQTQIWNIKWSLNCQRLTFPTTNTLPGVSVAFLVTTDLLRGYHTAVFISARLSSASVENCLRHGRGQLLTEGLI